MSWTDDSTGGNANPGPGEGQGPNGSGNPTNNPAPVDAVVVEYGRVLDLLSEGPIVGLVNGLKSVYLDETPIQNSDLTMNFKGLNVVGVKGTNTQSNLPGFPSVESEASVNTQVTTGSAVVRSITTTGATAARVKIRVPALQNINSTSGQASGTSVIIAIDVQNNGGGFVTQTLANGGLIAGQFDNPFTRAFRVSLPGTGPWDIRVRRITADSGSAYLQNDTWFDSLTAIVDSKLRYPNSAVFGVVVDAKQFRSIPERAYEIKGMVISVPTNYDPVARTYATTGPGTTGGVWDGTFKQAWTNNPAWVWYDLATSTRYGAGAFLDASKIDKYSLYTIGQYCDASVSDGKGGTEPRFTCNTYIQTRQEGIKLLNDLASVFRGMTYWAGGTVVPVQDVDASPAGIFTAANVEDGVFTYSGTALKARHTAALVTWNDPANGYRQAKEYVEDASGIARYGLNIAEITAFGCTSQAQARRAGVHLITSELTQPETVVFRTGLEGIDVLPGEVILVQDPFRAAQRFGGRAAAGASTTVVPLDASVTLAPATSYQLSVAMPDGTVATRAISTGAGTVSSLTLGSALPSAPAAGSIWVISVVGAMSLWRIVSIAEVEPTRYEITALAHNPSKYASIDSTTVTATTPSPTPTKLAPVTGLSGSSTLQVMKDQLRATLKASWTGNADATSYKAEYSEEYKPWVPMEVSGLSAQAWVAPGSTYRIRVLANYEAGVSPFVEITYAVPIPVSVPTDTQNAQNAANAAQASANYADTLARSSYNLIKNGNSEDASPSGMEAVGVSTDAPYTGTKCRKISGNGTDQAITVASFPCIEGEQFYASAMAFRFPNGSYLLDLQFFNAAGTFISETYTSGSSGSVYAKIEVSATAPANAVKCNVALWCNAATPSGSAVYFDCLYACRKIAAGMLEADLAIVGTIRSPNFTAGTSSAAPAGFKISGTTFTTTYLGGATDSTCVAEFGGSVNINGYKANAVTNRLFPTTTTWSTPGTYNWTCPEGVTEAEVTLVGGGGGGAGGNTSGVGGGGGGAGACLKKRISVTPGTVYSIVVGAGGAGGAGMANGNDGANSTFNTSTLVANGGKKGTSGTGIGGAGGGAVSGSLSVPGGLGGTGGGAGGAIGMQSERFEFGWVIPGAGGGCGTATAAGSPGGACDVYAGGTGGTGGASGSGGGGGGASDLAVGGTGGASTPAAGTAGTLGSGGGGGGYFATVPATAAGAKGGDGWARIRW